MAAKKPSNEQANFSNEIDRLKLLFETSSFCYQCIDSNGIILEVNSSWTKLLGYKASEVVGRWFGNYLDDHSRELFIDKFKDLSKTKDKCSVEMTLVCKDGSKVYAEFSCTANLDPEGAIQTAYCIFSNTTKLKLTEQALVESEQKYSRLVELSNVGIYELDPYTREFTYTNSVIRNGFGLSSIKDEKFQLEKYLDEDGKQKYMTRLKKLLDGEEVAGTTVYCVIGPNGEKIWIQITNSYVKDENGKVKIIGVAQNINELKELEMELQSYHDRLEQITLNLPSVIFQYTFHKGETSILYFSKNIKEMIGYTEEELKANPSLLSKLINASDYEKLVDKVNKSKSKKAPAKIRYRIKNREGNEIWVETILACKTHENGMELYTGISSDITESLELKDQLQTSEKKYEAIIQSSLTGISIMSTKGIVTSVNPRLCELSGYREDELVGKSFLKIPAFYKNDAKMYISLYKNALMGKLPIEPVGFKWRHKNGEQRWGEGFLSEVKDGGKTIAYQAVLTDTTTRVLLEHQEKERSFESQFLFESALNLLSINDESVIYQFLADRIHYLMPGSIVIVNSVSDDASLLTVEAVKMKNKKMYQLALDLLGNKIIGRQFTTTSDSYRYTIAGHLENYSDSMYDLTLKQLPKSTCESIERIINLDKIYEISLGTGESIIGGCAILLNAKQSIKHKNAIELLFREASAALLRIKANTRLNISERQYRSLTESTDDWIIRFNKDFQHTFVNRAVLSSYKLESKKLLGKTCSELGYSKEQSDLIESQLEKVFTTKECPKCEIRHEHLSNISFFEWNFYPEFDSMGENVESVLVNARNITEKKEQEGKLLDSISRKNKLYSILSHDLRTPFNSILGFLEHINNSMETLSKEELQGYLDVINDSASNAYSLLDSVLKWSVGYESTDSIKLVYFNLTSLVKTSIELYAGAIKEKELSIKNNISPEITVYADYNMIFTVLRNLLSNAIKFSKNKGVIELSAQASETFTVCSVKDYGKGIKQEDLETVFDRYESTSLPGIDGNGFGLGLKFSKELVTSNKGDIWVESEFGKGTLVSFTVPRGQEIS